MGGLWAAGRDALAARLEEAEARHRTYVADLQRLANTDDRPGGGGREDGRGNLPSAHIRYLFDRARINEVVKRHEALRGTFGTGGAEGHAAALTAAAEASRLPLDALPRDPLDAGRFAGTAAPVPPHTRLFVDR